MNEKKKSLVITLIIVLISINISSNLIKSSIAVSTQTIYLNIDVNTGEDVTLSWYLNPSSYPYESNRYGYSKPESAIYCKYDGASNWIYLTSITGNGQITYSKTLETPGNWEFLIRVFLSEGSQGQSYTVEKINIVYKNINCIDTSNFNNVDMLIFYDDAAANSLLNKWNKDPTDLPYYVNLCLDAAYKQYWGDNIDFHTSTNNEWFYYDPYQDYYTNWIYYNTLPADQGHGNKFDIGILFTSDVNLPYLGYKHPDFNKIVINLALIEDIDWWSVHPSDGLYSVLMHEVGHCFGITGDGSITDPSHPNYDPLGTRESTGDTTGERLSVMDYYYGSRQYRDAFDVGHQNTIALNLPLNLS